MRITTRAVAGILLSLCCQSALVGATAWDDLPYCHQQGAECITVSLKVHNPNHRSDVDRITLRMTSECTAPIGASGATTVISNTDEMPVDSGHTPLVRTWLVPAGCLYQVHVRDPRPWPYPDIIFSYDIYQGDSKKNVCVSWNTEDGLTDNSGCQ